MHAFNSLFTLKLLSMRTAIASATRIRNKSGPTVKINRRRNIMRRIFLVCGILSSLLYVAMNIIAASLYSGYSSVSQTVSELSAVGAATRTLWVWLGVLYGLLITAFAWTVWQSGVGNRPLRATGALLLAYCIIGFFWPFAPMHQRVVLAAGGGTISDILHIAISMITVPLMMLAIGFGARAFQKPFRIYSIITLLVLIGFGILTAIDGPKISRNFPTPWIGVWERVLIGVFLVWIIVLAISLLRSERKTGLSSQQ